MSNTNHSPFAISPTHEGGIRAQLESHKLPEHEIERIMNLPDCRNNMMWILEHVSLWKANCELRKRMLLGVGYSIDEADKLAKKYNDEPTLQWAAQMAADRNKPKDAAIGVTLLIAGSSLLVVAGISQFSELIETIMTITGIAISVFAISILIATFTKQ